MAEKLVTTGDFDLNTPATGDTVIVIDGNANHVTAGLDQKGDDYFLLETAHGFMKNLGASGSYLICNADVVKILGGGNVWLESDDNNVAGDDAMDDVLIQCMNAGNQVFLKTSVGTIQATCLWNRLQLNRGDVTLEANMKFDSNSIVSVGHVANRASDATIRLIAETGNGNAIPHLNVGGGRLFCTKTVTRCSIAGAEMDVDTNPITYLVIEQGGRVNYLHTAGTTIVVKGGGTLDLGQTRRLRAITQIIACEGARLLNYDEQLHTGQLRDFRQIAA